MLNPPASQRNKLGQFTSEGMMGNKINLGRTPWNKGEETPLVVREKQSKAKLKFYKENGNMIGFQKGKNNWGWKGGRIKAGGYIWIRQKGKYIPEHRLIMEKKIGRHLKPEELAHHINGIRDDNRPENLWLFKDNKSHILYESNQYFTYKKWGIV